MYQLLITHTPMGVYSLVAQDQVVKKIYKFSIDKTVYLKLREKAVVELPKLNLQDMPVYEFTITLTTHYLTGLRHYTSYDIDKIFQHSLNACREKWGRQFLFIEVVMVHKKSIAYARWLDEFRKKYPGKAAPNEEMYGVMGGKNDNGDMVQAPVKLTTASRFKMTISGRFKMTTLGRFKMTTY